MPQFKVIVKGNKYVLIENFFGDKFIVTNDDFATLKTGYNQDFNSYGHMSKGYQEVWTGDRGIPICGESHSKFEYRGIEYPVSDKVTLVDETTSKFEILYHNNATNYPKWLINLDLPNGVSHASTTMGVVIYKYLKDVDVTDLTLFLQEKKKEDIDNINKVMRSVYEYLPENPEWTDNNKLVYEGIEYSKTHWKYKQGLVLSDGYKLVVTNCTVYSIVFGEQVICKIPSTFDRKNITLLQRFVDSAIKEYNHKSTLPF